VLGGFLIAAQLPAQTPALQQPEREETLRVGIGIQPDTLEIAQVTNSAVANLLDNVVETLVAVDENGEIVPRLAKSWKTSKDGREFTFRLPRDVRFQDGTALDAAAVVWNFDRLNLIVESYACPVVEVVVFNIEEVKALSDDTVRFTLTKPLPNFLANLSWISWGILSPKSALRPGNELINIQRPIGTGPYAFATLSEERLQLTRFEDYRGSKPYYPQLSFEFISDSQAREKALRENELDVILLPSASQLDKLAQSTDYTVQTASGSRTIYVVLNNGKPPFDDVRVRRAVNMAVDKKTIIAELLRGAAKEMDSPLAPGVRGYCPTGSYDYDPASARKLLAAAGVESGTPLELLTPSGRYLEDEQAAHRIAGYLGAVGFEVTVKAADWPTLMGAVYRPAGKVTADMHLSGWAPTFPEAGWQLPLLYDSAMWPVGGPATSFYKNPRADELLRAARDELDPASRDKLFCQASQVIWDDAPKIFLWVQNFPVAFRKELTNIVSLPNERISAAFARPKSAPGAKPQRGDKGRSTGPAAEVKGSANVP
jgi:peptide/nickel transport system substrate-binding protein